MKLSLLVFLLVNFSCYANSFDSLWELKRDNTVAKVYSAKKQKNTYASAMDKEGVLNLKILKSKDFLNNLKIDKMKMLSYIGITNWKLSESKWVDNKLQMKGTYTDKNGQKIVFVEIHLYTKKSYKQLLYSQSSDQTFSKILSNSFFKNFGIKSL